MRKICTTRSLPPGANIPDASSLKSDSTFCRHVKESSPWGQDHPDPGPHSGLEAQLPPRPLFRRPTSVQTPLVAVEEFAQFLPPETLAHCSCLLSAKKEELLTNLPRAKNFACSFFSATLFPPRNWLGRTAAPWRAPAPARATRAGSTSPPRSDWWSFSPCHPFFFTVFFVRRQHNLI